MKKYLVSIASLAAMVGLVACQKTELKPSPITEGSTFTLAADIEQTKTTLNNLEVNWEEGDVLYLVTTDGTWGKPYKEDNAGATIAEYTYSAGTFASEATIANGTYTFNALYDGSASQKSFHRGASTTYNLQSTQSQDCKNPTAHLKNNDALVGSFTASVPRTTPASVSMSHIFAIMRVDVKNATGADVELKSFEMSAAGANLAGIFTVNFENTPIDITKNQNLSNSITVNLTNGTVAAGESLPVYFVMAPLADYSGDVTFTVTDADDKVYTKTVKLDNVTFSAGSLNTTPYKISTGVAPTCYTWDLSVVSTTEATEEKLAWTNDVADMVCTRAEGGTAANNYYPGASSRTSTRFYSNSTLSITPKTGKSLTYYVFEATTEGYATALANSTWTNANANADNMTVTVVATDPSKAVSAVIGGTCGFTKVECHTDAVPVYAPIITANPKSIEAPASGDVCTILYSIKYPVDGKSISAASDQSWVNKFDYSKSGEISFAVDANTGDARTASVTLSYEGAENVVVSISQNATGTVTEKEIEIVGKFTSVENGLSLTYQGITITQLKGTSSNSPSTSYATATTLRVYDGNTLTFSSDKTITKIVFTHTASYNGGSDTTADVGSYTRGTTSSKWTGSANKVTITNVKGKSDTKNIQIRPTKIVVTVLE